MPLKLVPSGACEGASFLALSDHEVTACLLLTPLTISPPPLLTPLTVSPRQPARKCPRVQPRDKARVHAKGEGLEDAPRARSCAPGYAREKAKSPMEVSVAGSVTLFSEAQP